MLGGKPSWLSSPRAPHSPRSRRRLDRVLLVVVIGHVPQEFGDVFDIMYNRVRMGQLFSLDKAYSTVR